MFFCRSVMMRRTTEKTSVASIDQTPQIFWSTRVQTGEEIGECAKISNIRPSTRARYCAKYGET
jgi:hypothetical protein